MKNWLVICLPNKEKEENLFYDDDNLKLFKCTLPGCDITLKCEKAWIISKYRKRKKLLPKHVPNTELHLLKNTIEIDILRGYTKKML